VREKKWWCGVSFCSFLSRQNFSIGFLKNLLFVAFCVTRERTKKKKGETNF